MSEPRIPDPALDASVDAFALLEQIVDARISRGLTTVVDTLGFDSERRARWLGLARAAGLPAVVVVFSTDATECWRRNALRDVRVPAPVLAGQLRRAGGIVDELAAEGWDVVVEVDSESPPAPASTADAPDLAPPERLPDLAGADDVLALAPLLK
jgi:predicted kinase